MLNHNAQSKKTLNTKMLDHEGIRPQLWLFPVLERDIKELDNSQQLTDLASVIFFSLEFAILFESLFSYLTLKSQSVLGKVFELHVTPTFEGAVD